MTGNNAIKRKTTAISVTFSDNTLKSLKMLFCRLSDRYPDVNIKFLDDSCFIAFINNHEYNNQDFDFFSQLIKNLLIYSWRLIDY